MGSVQFAVEDESQPSTSNGKSCKLSRTLLDGCDAVNHASIPRKLRSAIKKRGRESITSPLLISRKQPVDSLKKNGAKKFKLNMKQERHITKDEEEVAETLYALAGFFSDANKADEPGLDKKPEIKSSATLKEDTCLAPQEETRKMSSKVTSKAVFPSNLVNTTAEEIQSRTLKAPQLEFFASKQAVTFTPNAYGDQSEISHGSSSRPLVSLLGLNQNGEKDIHLDQVKASGSQYGKSCSSNGEKYKDLFLSPIASGATSSEMHKSCPRLSSVGIHSLFGSSHFSYQPRSIENRTKTEKHTAVSPESNTSWKRCSAHVYISRLIKVLQISNRKELALQPTQSTTCGGAERQSNVSGNNQMQIINGRNGDDAYFSAIDLFAAKNDSSDIKNILLDKRPIQNQQMTSETTALSSAKQGYDFLSLGTGICGLDNAKSANRAGEPSQQFHMPYLQSQNHSSMLSSLPQSGYSSSFHGHNSALAAQQVQLPQYHSSTGQQMDSQQQKWAAQQYNSGGGSLPRLPDWSNGGVDSASMLNYAHSLFPHLHAALGSKYQQLSPSQHQYIPVNSNISRLHHNLPLGFHRNGTVFRPDNMAQLQLP